MGFKKVNSIIVEFGKGTIGCFVYDKGIGFDIIPQSNIGDCVYSEKLSCLDEDVVFLEFNESIDSINVVIEQLEQYKNNLIGE